MPHSSTVSFLSYWRGLQTDPARAPSREAFDPARLKSLIPQMIMVSSLEPGYKFRLSGGFVVALHGHELKDTAFINLFRDTFHETVKTAVTTSLRHEQPVILTLSAPWIGRAADTSQTETVSVEVCLCPMMNTYGKVDRLVGILQTLSPMPRDPHGTIGLYSLTSARLHEPNSGLRAAHLNLIASEGRRIA